LSIVPVEVFMADATKPNKGQVPQEPSNSSKETREKMAKLGQDEFPVDVVFYDASTLKLIDPDLDLISFYRAGNKDAKVKAVRLEKYLYVLSGIEETTLVEVILSGTFQRNCESYVSGVVAFVAKGGGKEPCRVYSPLFRLEESCSVRFHAYDNSDEDDIDDKEAQLNDVTIVLTPVHSPQRSQETANPNVGRGSFTARTVNGIAEINGLARRQLYRLEVRGPQGYLCPTAPEFVQTCCDSQVDVPLPFQPCGDLPAPTFVFVRDGCSATRYSSVEFEAGGQAFSADQYGIWTVPTDAAGEPVLSGQIQINHPQRVFSPSTFELNADTPPAFIVRVSERAQMPAVRSVRGRFVDDDDEPFSHRKLTVQLPSGEEAEVFTDKNGYFEAPHGSRVYAKHDDVGLATEPLLLLSE
jgi:hypothetical protein